MRNTLRGLLFFSITAIVFSTGCLVIENPYSSLAPGTWRAVLELDPKFITPNEKGEPLPEKMNIQFEEVTGGELPFTFEVVYDQPDQFHIEIINGTERIRVDDIQVGKNKTLVKDTIRIDFPLYESYIVALFEENVIEGEWVVKTRENYAIPFIAKHGKNHRFTQLKKAPTMDISGKWAVMFSEDNEEEAPYPAIGEFQQEGNHLTGTFLTETGDYRYLEGTVQANKLYLSTFDGSHAFLFEGKILEDSSIIGTFRSGKHYKTTWRAQKDDSFQLTSADSLTYLTDFQTEFDFAFENEKGEVVSANDPQYQNKVRIVQILGTWCPNCRDETRFLKEYIAENSSEDLAIIGIAFEKHREKADALSAIARYRAGLELPYEILWGGYYIKGEAAKKLPMLNKVVSYPTMIFLDKKGKVRRIHTGFSGPATSAYPAFEKDFKQFMQKLLSE